MDYKPMKFTRGIVVLTVFVVASIFTISCVYIAKDDSRGNLDTAGVESEMLEISESNVTSTFQKKQSKKVKSHLHSHVQGEEHNKLTGLGSLPESRLKSQLADLEKGSLERAMKQLNELGLTIVRNDINSLHIDNDGNLIYLCSFSHVYDEAEERSGHTHPLDADGNSVPEISNTIEFTGEPIPISNPPIYHSLPGSEHVIYLDFNGGIVEETAWNSWKSIPSWDCKPYGKDDDDSTFNAEEQALIREIWMRVAENFSSFDIDVTTEEPAEITNTTAWAMITEGIDKNGIDLPHVSSGGIAYVNVYNRSYDYSYYAPAFVREYVHSPYSAYAAAHEIGHNLGLGHDGTSTKEYYYGHLCGDCSWAPIMGASTADVIQWSKGEYYDSNNTQDDLAIISEKVPYKNDDYSGVRDNSTTSIILPYNGSVNQSGLISETADRDSFAVTVSKGALVLSVSPFIIDHSDFDLWNEAFGTGLDVDLILYDENNEIVASNVLADSLFGEIEIELEAGRYFVEVGSTSSGTPLVSPPTGYTLYGSIGSYMLSMQSISTVDIIFDAGEHGTISSGDMAQTIPYGSSANHPIVSPDSGYLFIGWDTYTYELTRDTSVKALYAKEGAEVFFHSDITKNTGWGTTDGSDYHWISESNGFSGSSVLVNQPFDDWLGTCELVYSSDFTAGVIQFQSKCEGEYTWLEFYIDGVFQGEFGRQKDSDGNTLDDNGNLVAVDSDGYATHSFSLQV